MSNQNYLIPANEKYIEYFKEFMSDDFSTKIRIKQKANTARQYAEGIMDLLLYKTKIEPYLTEKQKQRFSNPEKRNRSECIEILSKNYSKDIADKFKVIFQDIGNAGSHFSGEVSYDQLQNQRNSLKTIIEDIFVQYFLDANHKFGTENIFTIFSMLSLDSRIYILEQVYCEYKNRDIVDRLSLAYVKNGQQQKANELLQNAYNDKIIDDYFRQSMEQKFASLQEALPDVRQLNSENPNKELTILKLTQNGSYVTGYPSNKNSFDIKKAVVQFSSWFNCRKDDYPEFINLFLSIMVFDDRKIVE